MRLYELTDEWQRIAELAFYEADAADGEVPADLVTQLHSIEGSIDQKLAACCRIVREMEAAKEAFNTEASRLKLKGSRCESHADSLKAYMKSCLESIDCTKREVDSIFTVAIQKSPPTLVVNNLDDVPESYTVKQERKIDTASIKNAIKHGIAVPGCELTQGTHLRIR